MKISYKRIRVYSNSEEMANTITHAFGIVLGLVAGYFLLTKAAEYGSWAFYSVLVYLLAMLLSYTASTLYHSPQGNKHGIYQKIDHAAIYIHIAGTYTPITLLLLRNEGGWGWSLFGFVWLFALIGTIWSFRKRSKHSYFETICYVAMGCSILIAFKPLTDVLQSLDQMVVLYWVIAGGVSYGIGAIFYSLIRIPYMHTVFHFFVVGGSICHIIAIYEIV